MDYFIVELEKEKILAIPLDLVIEVIGVNSSDVCSIPAVKSGLLGVINRRGNLFWLLDLIALFNLSNMTKKTVNNLIILVTKYQQKKFGLVVSKLREIKSIDVQDEILNNFSQVNENKYIKSQVKLSENERVNLIDMESIYNYISR